MGSILDACYWMLENQHLTRSEFQKHRASSIQYLGMFSISYIATTDSDHNNLCNCRKKTLLTPEFSKKIYFTIIRDEPEK